MVEQYVPVVGSDRFARMAATIRRLRDRAERAEAERDAVWDELERRAGRKPRLVCADDLFPGYLERRKRAAADAGKGEET
ncbi:MAG: hypothetical protein ABFC80_08110 [Coriobacteriales bacterium]